ncbi:MAG: PEP-CTERM sorting domain-containing protein [Pseudomonadota bacterium]
MKQKPLSLKSLSFAAVLLCAAAAAQADITVYTDRAAFLAALSSSGTDTFDDLIVSQTSTPLLRSAGAFGYRASAGPVSNFWPAGTTGGDVWLAPTVSNDTITFDSFGGLQAFGGNFFGSDAAGAFSPNRTVVLTATDGAATRTVNLYDTTVATFLGFISTDPLASVSLRTDGVPGGTAYWSTANDVMIGMPVPEAQTYAMLLLGLGLIGFVARSRG